MPAYASRDYGNRVGFWRMLEVLDRHRIRCTVNINLAVLEHFPEIRDAMLARDWDFCFHGFYNDLPEPRGLSEAEERAWHQRAIRMFYDLTGGRLSGANVLSRGSHHMPDLLAELGFLYHADWHREYGHRVGMFRLFELFDAHAIPATAAVDALTAQGYPQLLTECRRRGWEVIAHGVGQRRAITAEMSEADERAYIRAALDAVAGVADAMPKGWLSPEQSESTRTPGLLAELGVEYLCDWANDDQPYLIGRGGRPLVSLPLMQEISDVNLHWNRRVTMAQWAALVCEAFDTLYREGLDSGRLFVLPLHPWCIGQPFRVKYLDHVLTHMKKHDGVWTTTGGEIAAWYRRLSHDH